MFTLRDTPSTWDVLRVWRCRELDGAKASNDPLNLGQTLWPARRHPSASKEELSAVEKKMSGRSAGGRRSSEERERTMS
ncbi:hypothetical protein AOLI_G00103380 [Acnodon oligacanthus]